jgi:hypothetical protein
LEEAVESVTKFVGKWLKKVIDSVWLPANDILKDCQGT